MSAFLTALAVKERDNRFCVACHLHEQKFERLVAAAPTDLAGAHHRQPSHVGCIGCHGGADLGMRLRVWGVAAMDSVKFLVGAYREPDTMRLTLRDADCRVCHTPIVKRSPAPPAGVRPPAAPLGGSAAAYLAEPPAERQAPASFHRLRDHDSVDGACVRCHAAHDTRGMAAEHFLVSQVVQPVCRECHRGM